MHVRASLLLVASAFAWAGCKPPAPSAQPPAPASAASATHAASGWLGRWQGPEGTWLEVSGGPGTYSLTVRNLDGPRGFEAKEGTETLVFTRDGKIETLRRGDGVQTGMKWLAEKRDCLIVKAGEGYCRD